MIFWRAAAESQLLEDERGHGERVGQPTLTPAARNFGLRHVALLYSRKWPKFATWSKVRLGLVKVGLPNGMIQVWRNFAGIWRIFAVPDFTWRCQPVA